MKFETPELELHVHSSRKRLFECISRKQKYGFPGLPELQVSRAAGHQSAFNMVVSWGGRGGGELNQSLSTVLEVFYTNCTEICRPVCLLCACLYHRPCVFLSRLSWPRRSSRTACVRVWRGSGTTPSGRRRDWRPAWGTRSERWGPESELTDTESKGWRSRYAHGSQGVDLGRQNSSSDEGGEWAGSECNKIVPPLYRCRCPP